MIYAIELILLWFSGAFGWLALWFTWTVSMHEQGLLRSQRAPYTFFDYYFRLPWLLVSRPKYFIVYALGIALILQWHEQISVVEFEQISLPENPGLRHFSLIPLSTALLVPLCGLMFLFINVNMKLIDVDFLCAKQLPICMGFLAISYGCYFAAKQLSG